MTRVFLFHVTPLSRLRAIFSAQYLYSPSSLKLEGERASDLASAESLARRRRIKLEVPPGGALLDYVSFSLARQPELLYQSPERPPEQWAYLITDLETTRGHNAKIVFTDGDPNLHGLTQYYPAAHPLSALDWQAINQRRAPAPPTDPDLTRRRHASVLVYKSLPAAAILGIAVAHSQAEQFTRQLLTPLKGAPQIIVRPEWFEP